ncbi:MAG: hypothetical protein A2297_03520 [Elusimicrobia bacterium RIFOXYB2_FULL_48_7]|nr:MAG: hypothetical protein A2297_03520 [Elusimicrobia bacterium RIFOXYB2_FULL_48_7]
MQKQFGLPKTEFGPLKVVRIFDPGTNQAWAFVVIDNLKRGPSLGGTRMAPDISVLEVYGLASAMTFKNAAARLPIGGGKSGIFGDPVYYRENPEEKKRLITMFAEAIWPVKDYIPGPDMGTDEQDMQLIYDTFTGLNGAPNHGRGGVGRPPANGGLPLDEWGLTAHGLYAAAKTAQEYEPGFSIKGSRIIIQGFGNVGCPIAEKLSADGAIIVGASDINAGLFNPGGLDIEELARIRKEKGGLSRYHGKAEIMFTGKELPSLMNLPCDILVPAARPNVITAANADSIRAKIILQGANNPVDKATESWLQEKKGIACMTDFIVNAGGVIACAAELRMDKDMPYAEEVREEDGLGRAFLEKLVYQTVSDNVREIYSRLKSEKDKKLTWRDMAMALAKDRLK